MERLMQYVWQHRLIPSAGLATVDGRRVQVIDPGRLNTAAGPDFFNAKVMIDGRMWAGDVEIHVKATDWHRHGHDDDPAYDSVVLHVVDRDDCPIHRRNGEVIPQMQLPCSPEFGTHYHNLTHLAPGPVLACKGVIGQMERIYIADWLAALALERLHQKADRITALVERYAGDWDQALFITVGRALGFGTNSDALERLAASLPLRVLFKHADSILAIEAMLFGQSGLLDKAAATDSYAARLAAEYAFLAHKYGLARPQALMWKTGGVRPGSFPHRRIALLAMLVYGGFRLMGRLLEARTEEDFAALFNIELSGYWQRRYLFGPESAGAPAGLSRRSVRTLMINVAAPLVLAYGLHRGDPDAPERAVALLEQIPAESNSIVNLFADAGIPARDALTTQALIQLRRNYCETGKCLYCRIGHRMLASRALR